MADDAVAVAVIEVSFLSRPVGRVGRVLIINSKASWRTKITAAIKSERESVIKVNIVAAAVTPKGGFCTKNYHPAG